MLSAITSVQVLMKEIADDVSMSVSRITSRTVATRQLMTSDRGNRVTSHLARL